MTYVLLFISFLLSIFSGIYPFTFLGNYLIAHTFLLMYEEKIDLFIFKTSSYRLFVLSFLATLILGNLNYIWSRYKSSRKYWCKFKLVLIYFIILSIPILIHYFYWGHLPYLFLNQVAKSSWPFLLLFLPYEFFDFNKTIKYLSKSIVFILLILTPSIFFAFKNYTITFVRIRDWTDTNFALTISYYLNGIKRPLIHLTEVGGILWTIFSTTTIYYYKMLIIRNKKHRWRNIIILLWIVCSVAIGRSARMTFGLIYQVLMLILFSFKKLNKRSSFTLLFIISLFSIYLVFFNSEFHNKFVKEEINLGKEKNDYERRIPLLKYTLAKTLYFAPFTGYGYPDSKDEFTVLPSKESNAHATFHSEGIDRMFYFGVPWGFLSSTLYWLPFLILLLNYKVIFENDKSVFIINFILLTYSAASHYLGELGGDVYTDVIFVFHFVLLLKYIFYIKNKGHIYASK